MELDEIDQETFGSIEHQDLSAVFEPEEVKFLPLETLTIQLSAMFVGAVVAVFEGNNPDEHLKVSDTIFAALAES